MTDALAAFALVFVAELGDKSQLVVLTLAARYRPLPVTGGAVLAFGLLNALAVLAGAALDRWVPDAVLAGVVAVSFFAFGVAAWRSADDPPESAEDASTRSAVFGTFALIFAAELGDKTQLAVAGLATRADPVATWFGATAALAATTLLGATVGAALTRRLPLPWVKRAAAIAFFAFGAVALASVFAGR
jgi:putative Ca2+/H+ antiporter (TMEM165/GDT1 family)